MKVARYVKPPIPSPPAAAPYRHHFYSELRTSLRAAAASNTSIIITNTTFLLLLLLPASATWLLPSPPLLRVVMGQRTGASFLLEDGPNARKKLVEEPKPKKCLSLGAVRPHHETYLVSVCVILQRSQNTYGTFAQMSKSGIHLGMEATLWPWSRKWGKPTGGNYVFFFLGFPSKQPHTISLARLGPPASSELAG